MQEINVHIGEVKIAKRGEILKTILGSCVGIAIIWKDKNICGLAHCLLPESPTMTFNIGGRFVSQAVTSLVALMKIKPEDLPQVFAVVAGGGNMTSPGSTDSDELVGAKNYSAALENLRKMGIKVAHSDGGGDEGRKITVYSTDCTYKIEKIPRIAVAS